MAAIHIWDGKLDLKERLEKLIPLGEPLPMPRNSVVASFSVLLDELNQDRAPYIAYGIRYPEITLPHIAEEPIAVGIQAIEYLTSIDTDHGVRQLINMSVGFFAYREGWVFEQRFGSRTPGRWLPEVDDALHHDLREAYELRLRIWLAEKTNFEDVTARGTSE